MTKTSALYELKSLKKEFVLGKLTVPALRSVTLEINPGEIIALRGPSGSGKSTLLNVLGLLEVPSAGEISFLGRKLSNLTDKELTNIRRQSIGFIFQNYNLLPILSAQENVEYPLQLLEQSPAELRKRSTEVLEAIGLGNFMDHKPAQLSGGQQQRVSIARALVKNPQVILADEPTANLDSENAEAILKLLKKLKKERGSTIIIATHDDLTASYCDRKIELKDGKLV
jgi:putative ABC transport system ATP-binding protein